MATLLVYIITILIALLDWSRVFEIIGHDFSPSVTSRDRTFLFWSAHYRTYTYDTAAIVIRNYLIISEVLSPTIAHSPLWKLLVLAYYCKSYMALKIWLLWIAPVPATPATYGLRCGLRISVPATPEPRDHRKSAPWVI